MQRLLLMVACLLLCSCSSTVTTTASAIYDRHRIQNSLGNSWISLQADNIIRSQPEYAESHISASSVNNDVLLVGQTPSLPHKLRLTNLVRKLEGVHKVINDIQIKPPVSAWQRAKDTWITTKIKSQLLATKEINPASIKVITEDNVVYLMGQVPYKEGNAAVTIAKNTSDVIKVVKVFQWIQILNS